ncbi:MAG: type II toxin-antitoxin system Phd/YefM family antitoxin [Methylococcaceae bacterium]|nr:type II toxin-antitoxin system Phd/YefM family antitoxin [Methylococcaceae bacterium]
MKTSTIAEAKNNLSHLIRQLEVEEPVHLTRYGKAVAVMMSETQYNQLILPTKSLNSAILNWRSQLDETLDAGLREKELNTIRKESAGRDFSWDK